MSIKITTRHTDGRHTRSYKSLRGAQKAAQAAAGPTPEIYMWQATSAYGTVLTAEGCDILDLFPALAGRDEGQTF